MFHHHKGGTGLVQAPPYRVTDLQNTCRIQVGCWFVQQDQAGSHRQDACQRQALLLASGECRRRVIQRQPPLPHARRRRALRDAARCRGTARFSAPKASRHPPGRGPPVSGSCCISPARPRCSRGAAVDQERAGLIRFVFLAAVVINIPQHSGEGMQERGLAGTGRTQQQHALPRLDPGRGPEWQPGPGRRAAIPSPRRRWQPAAPHRFARRTSVEDWLRSGLARGEGTQHAGLGQARASQPRRARPR